MKKKGSRLCQPSDRRKLNIQTITLHKRAILESAVDENDYTIAHKQSLYSILPFVSSIFFFSQQYLRKKNQFILFFTIVAGTLSKPFSNDRIK